MSGLGRQKKTAAPDCSESISALRPWLCGDDWPEYCFDGVESSMNLQQPSLQHADTMNIDSLEASEQIWHHIERIIHADSEPSLHLGDRRQALPVRMREGACNADSIIGRKLMAKRCVYGQARMDSVQIEVTHLYYTAEARDAHLGTAGTTRRVLDVVVW